MLTPEGIAAIWKAAAVDWSLVVTDGSQEASAPAEVSGIETTDTGATITLTAQFAEAEANFNWTRRDVRNADGVTIDTLEDDHGRKAQGSVWTLYAELSFESSDS